MRGGRSTEFLTPAQEQVLAEFKMNPQFQELLRAWKEARMTPVSSWQPQADEKVWVYESGMQNGELRLLKFLGFTK